jgi:DnaJ-class molecular chaperone
MEPAPNIPEPCGHCHGTGKVKETKTLKVKMLCADRAGAGATEPYCQSQ